MAGRQRRERCRLCGQMRPTTRMLYYPSARSWLCASHTVDFSEVTAGPRW